MGDCDVRFHLNATRQPVCVCLQPENSSTELAGSVLYSGPVDPSQWVGLRKADGRLLDYLRVRQYCSGTLGGAVVLLALLILPLSVVPLPSQCNLVMLALLAFEVTISRHQELYRLRHNQLAPPTRTLFHSITRRHLDEGVLSCLKYLLNYFFYKFGLEVSFLSGNEQEADMLQT